MKSLEIIQGDTFCANIVFKTDGQEIDHSVIDNIYFTSKDLNIQKVLIYDDIQDKWQLFLSSQETSIFKVGVFTFDLTIKWLDNEIKTPVYQSSVRICKKNNEVNYGS